MRQYPCHFCNKICEKGESWPDWLHCVKCKTSYLIGFSGNVMTLFIDCLIEDKTFQLQMDYIHNYSRIVILPDSVDGTMIMVMDFPFLLKNVTPTNLVYKIKTSVLFS